MDKLTEVPVDVRAEHLALRHLAAELGHFRNVAHRAAEVYDRRHAVDQV
jgi:hypothetical protein